MGRKLFTSESVTEGHPDKMCDQISDAILDAFLRDDPESRVACEVAATTGMIFIFGEISSNAVVDCAKIARDVVRRIGYTSSEMGFDADTCSVVTSIGKQSCNIAQGVDHSSDSGEIGAGDQGMVFGYACNETPELMPLSISLAHKLAQKLAEVRKNGEIVGLRPDGKTQVTIEYDEDKPIKVDTVIVSAQHDLEFDMAKLKKMIFEKVVIPTIPFEYYRNGLKLYVNPTGCFEIGGPHGDIECVKKHLIYHIEGEDIEISANLSDAYSDLKDFEFYQVHQGYIVNLKKIYKIDDYMIILTNGNKVPISVRKKTEVITRYADFMEKNL